jgi:hypothetical protein
MPPNHCAFLTEARVMSHNSFTAQHLSDTIPFVYTLLYFLPVLFPFLSLSLFMYFPSFYFIHSFFSLLSLPLYLVHFSLLFSLFLSIFYLSYFYSFSALCYFFHSLLCLFPSVPIIFLYLVIFFFQ